MKVEHDKPPWIYRIFYYIVGLFKKKNITWYIGLEDIYMNR